MRRLLLITLALLGLAPPTPPPARCSSASTTNARLQIPRLEALGLDVTHEVGPGHADVIVHEQTALDRLRRAGFAYSVTEPDLAARWRADRARSAPTPPACSARASPGAAPPTASMRTTRRRWTRSPPATRGFVRKVTPPRGRPSRAATSSAWRSPRTSTADDGRPVYVVMGLHHAREWPSAEVNPEFALDLVRNYGSDARITSLLDRLRDHRDPGDQRRRLHRLAQRSAEDRPAGLAVVPAQELPRGHGGRGRGPAPRGAARRRPQPQLLGVLGRQRREPRAAGRHLPRPGARLRARGRRGPRLQQEAPHHELPVDPQRRRAACCASPASRRSACSPDEAG